MSYKDTTGEHKMGQLIDCRYEFVIRKQYNHINRVLTETGHAHRVILIVEQDQDSETGVGFALYDKYSKTSRKLDPDLYTQIASVR
jgi:hypothetical protein